MFNTFVSMSPNPCQCFKPTVDLPRVAVLEPSLKSVHRTSNLIHIVLILTKPSIVINIIMITLTFSFEN